MAFPSAGQADDDVPPGVPSVETLLRRLSADSVIVMIRDAKTGAVLEDPKLGIPRFLVPDSQALARSVRSHRMLMKDQKSRMSLIGCAKLGSEDSVPMWADLLRSVGREWDDKITVEISYQVAAKHGAIPLKPKAIETLGQFMTRAIQAKVLEYHEPEKGGLATIRVADSAKLVELIDAHRDELGPDVIDAAIAFSGTQIDHTPLLKAIGERLSDPLASAFASETAGKSLLQDLKPEAAANEFDSAIQGYNLLRDTPSQARVLLELARTNRELGKSDNALDNLRKARKILGLVHDGKHVQIAVALKQTAEIYFERGEVQRSLQTYIEAAQAFIALPSDQTDLAESADVHRLFAGVNLLMGHLPEGRENLQQALFLIHEAETLPGPPETRLVKAKCLRDLGLLNLVQGRLPEARKSIDAALEIQMNALGAVDPETIQTLLALGQVCAAANQPGEAEFVTRQAAIFLQHHYGPHHPALVRAQAQRTAFRLARSESELARKEIELGLKFARVPGQLASKNLAELDYLPTRDSVALLTWKGELALRSSDKAKDSIARRNHIDEAIKAFLSAERLSDTIRGAMPGDGDRMIAGDLAPEYSAGLLGAYLRQAEPGGVADLAEPIFAAAERSTARSLISALGQEVSSRLRGISDDDRAQERKLFLARDTAMKRFNRQPYDAKSGAMTPAQSEAWGSYQKATEELTDFNHKLHPKESPEATSSVETCSSSQAVELLGKGEVAVSFVLGARESFAVLLARAEDQKSPKVRITRLPAANLLDEKIAALLELRALASIEEKKAGEDLYDLLLGPLADQVGQSDLLIVPTGALCRLPFELLREPGPGGRRYLGESRAVRYAPSLTGLRVLRDRDQLHKSRPDRAFWAMANPRDLARNDPPSELDTLPSLTGALDEVKRIAAILAGGEPASLLVETEATRLAVLNASQDRSLRRYRYLHFATHGSMEDEAHPLPGLILARAPGEEGYLDIEDVSHLDLNADLVVLSACESGRGRIFNGEGVRGLSSSFLIAGARGVVCSLWKVDDQETARFMEAFYARLKVGDSPAQALKEVRRVAAQKQASTEWSAFILIGGVSP